MEEFNKAIDTMVKTATVVANVWGGQAPQIVAACHNEGFTPSLNELKTLINKLGATPATKEDINVLFKKGGLYIAD